MSEDAIARFKEAQRQGWKHFAPLEALTTPAAARLVKFANVRAGQNVLDVGCGTGVAAITAARIGARVRGVDLTPELLERARENARIANMEIDFREGDAEALPFDDVMFDVVLSHFGHMFAPRPAVAIGEMLRVLKPGGTIAFTTWPPELLIGSSFNLVANYMPPPPPGVSPPPQWGDVRRSDVETGGVVTHFRPRAASAVPRRIRRVGRAVFRGQCRSAGLSAHSRGESVIGLTERPSQPLAAALKD